MTTRDPGDVERKGSNPAILHDRARRLADQGFLGGPAETYEAMGRLQLITLLRCGLYPDSRVLDLGCGTLRGGFWLVHFLRPDRYFGIEPNVSMLQLGCDEILGSDLIAEKRPRFLTNDRFDPSEFGERFDFFLARSIWTHASREQIRAMLGAFEAHATDDAAFLASYLPAGRGRKGHVDDEWVGRSHESEREGVVHHDSGWIASECAERGFAVHDLPVDRTRQIWLLITKGAGAEPTSSYLSDLVSGDSIPAAVGGRLKRMLARMSGRSQH